MPPRPRIASIWRIIFLAPPALEHAHHLLHLLKLLQELVDLDDLDPGALGDAQAAIAVEDVRLAALLLASSSG
jgi:hypothetical protein